MRELQRLAIEEAHIGSQRGNAAWKSDERMPWPPEYFEPDPHPYACALGDLDRSAAIPRGGEHRAPLGAE